MIRALSYVAFFAFFTCGPLRSEELANLQPHQIDRFQISLPSGSDWFVQQGGEGRWVNYSRRVQTAESDLYVWIGFEVNSHPENRYDWLPAEIAREVRDVQAMALLKEADEIGRELAILEYGEDVSSTPVDYWLVWARQTYVEQLQREVPEYQELHVFLPDDHSADFKNMAIYFGVYCLAQCATDYPTAELLEPVLDTVKISRFKYE